MDSLQEARRLMLLVQKRVDEQEVISGEVVIQMLSLYTNLAKAEQSAALAEAARQQTALLERIAVALEERNA